MNLSTVRFYCPSTCTRLRSVRCAPDVENVTTRLCATTVRILMRALAASVVMSTVGIALSAPASLAPDLATAQKKMAAMTVPFVPNAGQWDKQAAFAARTFAGTVFVTTEGKLVYSLPPAKPADGAARNTPASGAWSLTESFVSATGEKLTATPHGYRPAETKVSYFTGNDATKHQSGLNTYDRVNLGDVFAGINVQLRATHTKAGSNVEKIFTVAPHRDPGQIHVRIDGAKTLEIGSNGELIVHTDNGPVTYTAPIAFQEDANGLRQAVQVQYALAGRANDHQRADIDAGSRTTYAFTLGRYDESKPLIIDPMLQATYVGGSDFDLMNAVAVHPQTGDVYVTGSARSGSTNFPGLAGGADDTFNGGFTDVVVSRFSGDLKRLIQSTLIGGVGNESATAIAIHPGSGDIYVAGSTASKSGFPGLSGAAQQVHGGATLDPFVSHLAADLKTLYRSSYLGGSSDDSAYALAIHPATGLVYVAGTTLSSNFPGALEGAQSTYGGSSSPVDGDAFITSFSADLGTRQQSTYLGGADSDSARVLSIHPVTGEVYVAGWTLSAAFPFGSGIHAQAALNGSSDAFVVRLAPGLTTVRGGTYLGGAFDEAAAALAIDPTTGEVIVAGSSNSDASGQPLPGLVGAAQPTNGGGYDAFVSRLSRDLSSVLQSTYLGGSGRDDAYGVAINPASGEIYVTGRTASANFPSVAGGIQDVASGLDDAFVVRLSGDLRRRLQATYLGTAGTDAARAMAIHPISGHVIVVGLSDANGPIFVSSTATVLDGTATALTYGGEFDGVVARLSTDLTAMNTIPNSLTFIAQSNVPPNALRVSNEQLISGVGARPERVYVTGAAGSQLCLSSVPGCCAALPSVPTACASPVFVSGWTTSIFDTGNNEYVTLRHTSAVSGPAETNLLIGGIASPFRTSTGNARIACNLDINADNTLSATLEGLVLLRAMLGITGIAVVAGTGVSNATWDAYRVQLNSNCGANFF